MSRRYKNSIVLFALEEFRFIKSYHDLKNLFQKICYVLPRKVRILDRQRTIPPSLQIEPTNCCNVRCISCSAPRSRRPRGYMQYGLFQNIINNAAQIGVKRIYLYLHGEPLLHPGIVEMMKYIKAKGLAVNLTTNGLLLNNEKIEAILDSGINSADYFTFSIFGYSKETHERIMKGAIFEKALRNISEFMELREKLNVNGPIIETIFHTMPENEFERDLYVSYWRGKVDHVKLGGRVSTSFSEYKRGGAVIPQRKQTCNVLWERMTVFWDGYATICCEDVDGDWVLGNLKDHSIQEIWNCEQLSTVRNIHKEMRFPDFPFCSNCDL